MMMMLRITKMMLIMLATLTLPMTRTRPSWPSFMVRWCAADDEDAWAAWGGERRCHSRHAI